MNEQVVRKGASDQANLVRYKYREVRGQLGSHGTRAGVEEQKGGG